MADDSPDAPEDREPELTPEEEELVKRLRAEANDVKDCVTKIGFQALALSTVVLGTILPLLNTIPLAGFAAAPLAIFLLAAIRISLHKYETANRLYGYELHIYRRTRLKDSKKGWHSRMRQIGWEEAFYAWRVVQPFIYKKIYLKPRWYTFPLNNYVKKKQPYDQENDQFWFLPTRLTGEKNVAYEAGDYLYILHFLLTLFAICAGTVLFYMSLQLSLESPCPAPCRSDFFELGFLIIAWLTTLAIGYTIGIRALRMRAKRRILQDELLSINSCAIVWLAAVVAHFRALEALGAKAPDYRLERYEGYTPMLAEQARKLRRSMPNIYEWVHEGPDAPGAQPNPQ